MYLYSEAENRSTVVERCLLQEKRIIYISIRENRKRIFLRNTFPDSPQEHILS